jgi:hypothetical protein
VHLTPGLGARAFCASRHAFQWPQRPLVVRFALALKAQRHLKPSKALIPINNGVVYPTASPIHAFPTLLTSMPEDTSLAPTIDVTGYKHMNTTTSRNPKLLSDPGASKRNTKNGKIITHGIKPTTGTRLQTLKKQRNSPISNQYVQQFVSVPAHLS